VATNFGSLVDQFFDHDIYFRNKTLMISGDVDEKLSKKVIKGLHVLDSIKPDESIIIILNSPGGDVDHGLAIYDAIRSCRSHVEIRVYGVAMSMGSVILQAGDSRIISPHSRLMIHYGSVSLDHTTVDAIRFMEEMKDLDILIENIYLRRIKEKHPRFSRNKLKELLKHDCYLSAKEAVDQGLADKALIL